MNHHSQGRKLFKKGRHQQAVQHFQRHLSSNPEDAKGHLDLAAPLYALGDLNGAEQAATEATRLGPQTAEAWATLATIQAARGQKGAPLRSILKATGLEPDNLGYRVRLGTVLIGQGHLGLAAKNFDLILKGDPTNLDAIAGKSAVLEREGESSQAYDLMKTVIFSAPPHAWLGTSWGVVCCRLGHYQEGISVIVTMLSTKMNKTATAMLLGELGALYAAQGEHEAAWAAYTEANLRRLGVWDPQHLEDYVDQVINVFTAEFFDTAPRSKNTSALPILIVGMPRSGTSLVEQILSAHPQVHGAGELSDMRAASLLAAQYLAGKYPQVCNDFEPSTVNRLGEWYLARRGESAPTARFVTDKMPQNFQFLGLAALMLPGVRIVHCVRDPLDTALSCFFQGFQAPLAWSNRLEWLGPYMVQYRRLMAHWEAVLPIPIYNIEYERLVADPEAEIRALLGHCEIPFDPAVLKHHESRRQVVTASYAQANRPIYRSSAGKSAAYAKHLAPIKQLLGD